MSRAAYWWRCLTAFMIVSAVVSISGIARANQSTFRTYAADQGLSSLSGTCLMQNHAGYLFVCTEEGVFAYDGRRFINLGPEQGLLTGGVAWEIAQTPNGRIAVRYVNELFLSDPVGNGSGAPSLLHFKPVRHGGVAFYDETIRHLVAWRDGFVLLAGDTVVRIVPSDTGPSHIETLRYSAGELQLLQQPVAVFTVRGVLWESLRDGRLCSADPGSVRCYGPAEGLGRGPWIDLIAERDGRLLARGPGSVATLDASARGWSVVDLPDQGARYANYAGMVCFIRAPDGELLTQAVHGLDVLTAHGWHALSVQGGAPAGIVGSALTDISGTLWFQIIGQGLVRWIGFGHWQTLQAQDGLSDGLPWEMARTDATSLWLATDTGVDELVDRDGAPHVARILPGASYAIAAGQDGTLWLSTGNNGVALVDTQTGRSQPVAVPPVNAIVPYPDRSGWIGTTRGLYHVAPRAAIGEPHAVRASDASQQVVDLADDKAGGAFYLANGRLRHFRADGRDVQMDGAWPGGGFEPLTVATDRQGHLWIGGSGGLFRMTLAGDTVRAYDSIPTEDTRTNNIVSVIVDHRGWVWAGTGAGISVFNGQRWVSANAETGLVSDDVNQRGLLEDADGSIWISTSQGISHLLDPEWLFANRPVNAVISGALLGNRPVQAGQQIPYTTEALSVQFGTPNDGAERSFVFRYNLSGVDTGWAESATGLVRYPFVPPGHHMLTVVGYNELTHQSSTPETLTINVAYPWWRQWWAEVLWVLLAVAAAFGLMRLRFRVMLARQAELKRYIAEATQQLAYQAAHDSLTGLLNRSEIEGRLAKKLSSGRANDEMIIALVDIDHFKKVNDNHGHLGGDDVLRTAGRMVSRALRDGEYAGRYGGEEFLLVLDDSDGRGAERVLDLHHTLRGNPFSAAGKTIQLTCSIGLAWARRGDNWESLIGRADDALYKAKAGGRDKVVESGRVNKPASQKVMVERRLRPSAL